MILRGNQTCSIYCVKTSHHCFKWKHCRNYLPLFILFPWSLFQPQISMFYQCKLPHMLKVIFITFFWNLIHKWVTPSRLLQYVCVFSTNWEAVCTCEDWAAVLLQLHVLAHRGVGYVSLPDGIVLGRCIHFFQWQHQNIVVCSWALSFMELTTFLPLCQKYMP